jgi:hypothetical protein
VLPTDGSHSSFPNAQVSYVQVNRRLKNIHGLQPLTSDFCLATTE